MAISKSLSEVRLTGIFNFFHSSGSNQPAIAIGELNSSVEPTIRESLPSIDRPYSKYVLSCPGEVAKGSDGYGNIKLSEKSNINRKKMIHSPVTNFLRMALLIAGLKLRIDELVRSEDLTDMET